MTVTGFAWYIAGVLAMLAVVASLATYHPDVQRIGEALPLAFGGGSLIGFGMAVIFGRLPVSHWVHQSKPVKLGMSAVAVAVTVLLVMVG